MTHPRRAIRDAIAARIRNGATDAETRVWASREPPVKVDTVLIDQGPIILVYTRKDIIKPEDYPASGYDGAVCRTLEVAIEITAVGASAVDDKLDGLTEQVESLLEGFDIPGFPATELRLESTEIESSEEFEKPLGGALMLYEAKYWKEYRKAAPTDEDWVGGGAAFFPETVSAAPSVGGGHPGTPVTPEQVASCDDCADGECPVLPPPPEPEPEPEPEP